MQSDLPKTTLPPVTVIEDGVSPDPPPMETIAFHYSLSGLLKLFILIALLMAVISKVPWLAVPIVPITIACLRTYQVAKHRRLVGKPLSGSEGVEVAASTLIVTILCCLSLLVAALVAYHFGSLCQAMMFGDSFDLMAGGILMAMLSVGGMSYAWWRTIRKNWAYDMQGAHSELYQRAHVPPRPRFRFGLASIFELTTLAAIVALLFPTAPGTAVTIAGPYIVAMIYTARFANERLERGEAVSAGARYGLFLRVFLVSVMLLIGFAFALGGGWMAIGFVTYEITRDVNVSLALGALGGVSLAGTFIAAVWYLHVQQLLKRPKVVEESSSVPESSDGHTA